MTTTDTDTAPTVPADPLEMARNCLASMAAKVAYLVEGDTDPEKRIRAHVNQLGAQSIADSEAAARLALVSIAEDVRRYVDHVIGQADFRA